MRARKIFILLYLVFWLLCLPSFARAYIGPGAGFAVMGSFLAISMAMLSAVLALVSWPIRYVFRYGRGRKAFARSRVRKVVILGLDGLDPLLTERFMSQGKLPNLAALKAEGCFKPLQSTIPPISPVAWSSFQTGSNPGKHNIFDFLSRDKNNYLPILSSVDIRAPRKKLSLGPYEIPLGKPDIRLLRKGKPFWITLGEHGIFSNILRVPITFPPEKFRGVQLSAMCVPDMRGTQGMFSFFTTRPRSEIENGGETFFVSKNGRTVRAALAGPENPFRKDRHMMKCPFTVSLNGDASAGLRICGKGYTLETGRYSDWIPVVFKAAPGIHVKGICKFLLLGTSPDLELYVTPINIDPDKPVMPISYPTVYATYFSKQQGPFATLGLAEDTWALNEKVLHDEGFLAQCLKIEEEREKMFLDALAKVKQGLCVCVFDGTDRIQHTFWRYMDEGHPAGNGLCKEKFKRPDAILNVYERMDALVGKALAACQDEHALFMVISDHGFSSFRYGVDLNRWLEENGYLKVKEDQREEKYLSAVDWSETRAFAIGLAGIYLNIHGREARGIVDPGDEADALREEIAEKLTGLFDPVHRQPAINRVFNAKKVYNGPYTENAPDLIVGYHKGYRASWETAIGQVSKGIIHDNTKAWSGDHCIDTAFVPGVLFCNRKIATEHPRLMDIGPTVLDMLGVDVPGYMDGRPLDVES